jgi:hypothetical protein
MAFWDKLTFEQYFRALNSGNDPDLLNAAILGPDWEQMPAIEVINAIAQYNFAEPFPDITGKPESIMGYKVPDDLGWMGAGQYRDLVALGRVEDNMPNWPKMVAIFIDKEINGDYNYPRALEIEKDVWQSNGLEVHKFVTFFFSKMPEYLNGMKVGSKAGDIQALKKWQGIQRLMMFSGSKRNYTA